MKNILNMLSIKIIKGNNFDTLNANWNKWANQDLIDSPPQGPPAEAYRSGGGGEGQGWDAPLG